MNILPVTIVDRFYPRRHGVAVVGHRGSRATHPENTLSAFRHAIACGADAVELDVVVTTDGELAVTHDPVDAAFADLPAGIPRLEDVLALSSGNEIVFDIEMKECGRLTPKPEDYARMVLARVSDASLHGRIMVRSFEHEFLRAMHSLNPDLPLVTLVENGAADWVRVCEEAFAVCISPRFEDVTAEAVIRAHAAGLGVIPWTVNDPADWTRLISIGVDAIVTDDPAALVRFIASREMPTGAQTK
jgi:glycerophosphoryl diester phosphodiesterase